MVVQHNLSAMNTNRQMGVVSSALQKSTEKLSSGYKINRAGDDAAGLSISEKMRSQIRGLNKASLCEETVPRRSLAIDLPGRCQSRGRGGEPRRAMRAHVGAAMR